MSELHIKITKLKANLIDKAYKKCKFSSFADLGGCWGVNGGYTFYTLSSYDIVKAYIVDNFVTEIATRNAKAYPQLTIIQGDFGNSGVIDKIDTVDAIIAYDILLHQVSPNWDEILRKYSDKTNLFIIYNQMFTGSKKTTRLIELGKEEYLKNTPYRENGDESRIDNWFRKHDEIDPRFNKKYKDSPNFWQWGITDADLVNKMWGLGFKVEFMENYGNFKSLPLIENHAFLFIKTHNNNF